MIKGAALILLSVSVAACQPGGMEENRVLSDPVINQIVDNLYVVDPPEGTTTAGLGGTAGILRLDGRCLVLSVGSEHFTPVFRGGSDRLVVGSDSLQAFGLTVEYGEELYFPRATAGSSVNLPEGSRCPKNALFVPMIERPDSDGIAPAPPTPARASKGKC